jgi:hypothetical protein
MATVKLTKTIKESIAINAIKELFVPSLRECWKSVEAQFSDLVKEVFKDFDWEHVGPYRGFINWYDEIRLYGIPEKWNIYWDKFREVFDLPSISSIHILFEYPSAGYNSDSLDNAYWKRAEGILRPYMIQYFIAKERYEDIGRVLLGLSTWKQLEDTVPELVKYAPKIEARAATALVPIAQINRVRNFLRKEEPDGKDN